MNANDLQYSHEYVATLNAEIKRLRGLLQEAVQIDQGDFRINVDEWMTRVREALDDE